MKIKNAPKKNIVKYKEILPGECFQIPGDFGLLMRMGETELDNAVRLGNGEVVDFLYPSYLVERVNASVVIE